MGKRVFTKVLSGLISVAQTDLGVRNALAADLQQEDIEVIGAEVLVYNYTRSENDGKAFAVVELSQAGTFGSDGSILAAIAQDDWNTTPVNAWVEGKSAGASIFKFDVRVFYTKKGSR